MPGMGFILLAMLLTVAAPSGVVLKPVANMYSAPTEEADVVSQAIFGTNLHLLEERNGWVRVRTPDQYAGWMPASSVWRIKATERPYASGGRVAQVASLFANLYRESNVTLHQPVVTLPFESRLEVVDEPDTEDRRWVQVRLPDRKNAWIQRGDVTFETGHLSIQETIALSKRFLGLPYLWGGTSSYGYDCSGFTQMLSRQRGISIPRDAGPQAGWEGAVEVERSGLQPGDLLYFGESPEKITHSGMYIGNSEFIHATTRTRPVVQISRLDDEPWTTQLVAARRPK